MDNKTKQAIKIAAGVVLDLWMPVSKEATASYMNDLREKVKGQSLPPATTAALAAVKTLITGIEPVILEFYDLINNNSIVRMNFKKMIDEVPSYYREPGAPGFYLSSVEEMLLLINHILKTAPKYNDTDLVGFPINTILNWTMGVPSGAAAFRNESVNKMFRKVLAVWTEYLNSRDSLSVFTTEKDGWCCDESLAKLKMEQYLNEPELTQFKQGIKNVDDPFPYTSWNDFFTRLFKDEQQRPIADTPIVSACDSQVYNTQTGAKLQDWFWLKSQPYSLWDMLANKDEDGIEDAEKGKRDEEHFHKYVEPFDGGTVYQAFLSAFKYHRWHSPVAGTIKKAYVKEGTYYSATQAEGMDQGSPDLSQGYIAHTAARALIFIEADDPRIGLLCMIPIGMSEVSSCIINDLIKPGAKVSKGQELGYFQFGGSTHCLVFKKDVIKEFTVTKDTQVKMGQSIAVLKPL